MNLFNKIKSQDLSWPNKSNFFIFHRGKLVNTLKITNKKKKSIFSQSRTIFKLINMNIKLENTISYKIRNKAINEYKTIWLFTFEVILEMITIEKLNGNEEYCADLIGWKTSGEKYCRLDGYAGEREKL